jgi:membrane dipeptidase
MHTQRFIILAITCLTQMVRADGQTLLGTVRDRHTGKIVVSAAIQIIDRRGIQLGTTVTNSLGEWRYTIPTTGINDGGVPRSFGLEQNYPNPFNPSTKIPFSLGREGSVRISVYNILGQLLDTREFVLRPGSYTIDWNAKGSAGVLFYSVDMDNIRLTRKMVQLDGGNRNGLGNMLQMTSASFSRVSTERLADSCRIITSSLVFETDTTTVALTDTTVVNTYLDSIHDRAFMVDLHNDLMEMISGRNFNYQIADRHVLTRATDPQTDLPRLRDGGVDAQIFSVWISPTQYPAGTYFSTAMRFLDTMKAQFNRNSADIGIVTRSDSVASFTQRKKIAGIVVVEGGHCLEDKLDNLLTFYNAGVRVMTITWNNSTTWAVSAQDESQKGIKTGLNEFGKQVVRTMDSLGMIIDVSHVGPSTVDSILATSKNPIIASHSGAYALRSHYRNLTDAQIRAIAARGGVIGVVFYPTFLVSSGQVKLDNVVQHIDYIKNLVGVDYVALGSDFDGIETTPVGLEDVSRFPALTEALLQKGYTRQDVRKILGENFMRVFRAVCK